MTEAVRNIYCVGRNYRAHAAELGNDVPDQPMIFTKPTHALASMNGEELTLPGNQGEIHYETELVLHIAKPYTEGIQVDDIVDKYALGIDFTLRDVQNVIKKKGQPWLPAKGFLKSAPISTFRPFPGASKLAESNFQLRQNGQVVQNGNISNMIFDLQTIIDYIAKHYGLGAGDIIFTGTPEGVGPVHQGDRLELLWGEEVFGAVTIKM
ncbi:fumarylacetoacetate hydrolase family protein [Paenibacillus alginolyticus]|uniref:Fumarylacetoacetate hydrolase family protein n=1 Tax=Paenibacillus alginolyticus TaxID=59839 RepID=A0ABT4GBJ1_9BACL|nr:fumarylacetoacetate hydrolase family protein [Paenibacillus alginolyticus]MCY9664075.1 fumarylacetoacetate hydrolase family protein [Paenibacillus alginolyticus]MCY9693557.1 fumarylacetoacetate hydrolase family protein [Paenibacillus alginolyticus]MEC0144410.1 fumarylacetoacetate hydrolase family protein [Paenibacillus alginolyticus]